MASQLRPARLRQPLQRNFLVPDPEARRLHALRLAEELAEFERPMPLLDEYDLLLGGETAVLS